MCKNKIKTFAGLPRVDSEKSRLLQNWYLVQWYFTLIIRRFYLFVYISCKNEWNDLRRRISTHKNCKRKKETERVSDLLNTGIVEEKKKKVETNIRSRERAVGGGI